MEKTVLNEVYKTLHKIGAIRNEAEFSKDWLCRSECYMRTLRHKKAQPSLGALAICASKLQHYGNKMASIEQHKLLATRFLRLSNECHKQINEKASRTWLQELMQ